MKNNLQWNSFLEQQQAEPYFTTLMQNVKQQRASGEQIFPPEAEVFRAFELAKFNDVKVVILGQDPYHGFGQANGLSFSVNRGQKIPPSLRNIFKELAQEFADFTIPNHGDLTCWAEQGVMLLNAVLTVKEAQANSHKDLGWHTFTDKVIEHISENNDHVVFILWGAFAQKKKVLIDESRHMILESPHPSPLSARRGFFGCNHFIKANDYLIEKGKAAIDWHLPL